MAPQVVEAGAAGFTLPGEAAAILAAHRLGQRKVEVNAMAVVGQCT